MFCASTHNVDDMVTVLLGYEWESCQNILVTEAWYLFQQNDADDKLLIKYWAQYWLPKIF